MDDVANACYMFYVVCKQLSKSPFTKRTITILATPLHYSLLKLKLLKKKYSNEIKPLPKYYFENFSLEN